MADDVKIVFDLKMPSRRELRDFDRRLREIADRNIARWAEAEAAFSVGLDHLARDIADRFNREVGPNTVAEERGIGVSAPRAEVGFDEQWGEEFER